MRKRTTAKSFISIRNFALACLTVFTASVFAQPQQPQSVGTVHAAPPPTSTTPDEKTAKAPAAPPGMSGMQPNGDPRKSPAMNDDAMGAIGLLPPGIMVGAGGRWMAGYQVMFDRMDDKRGATTRVADASTAAFMATPTEMTMRMQMGMVMYAPTDRLTLMAMVPYIDKSMNHIMRDGTRFNEQTGGVGDVDLRGLYTLYARNDLRHRFLLNAGIGLPTGSIDRRMEGARLEYPMQSGSGTVSLMPGLTYLGQSLPWGWGAEIIPTLRVGTNSNNYRLGNRFQPSVWIARQVTPWMSVSARANGDLWQNIRGADAALDIMDESTKNAAFQGGKRLDVTLGVRLHPQGVLSGQTFFVDANKPILQSLRGPQLERRWVAWAGWQKEF